MCWVTNQAYGKQEQAHKSTQKYRRDAVFDPIELQEKALVSVRGERAFR